MPSASLNPSLPEREPPSGRPGGGVHVSQAPVGSALLRLLRAHAQLGTALLARIGVPPPQELVLLRLEELGTLSQGDLVRYLNRDRSTTSATLQAMERAGLITRSPSRSDRRALDVSITDAGRALCPAVRDAWAELEETAFSHLSSDGRAALIAAMDASQQALAVTLEERSHDRASVPSDGRRQQ
jgi:DNA-binding MarR family transcriptional regulator